MIDIKYEYRKISEKILMGIAWHLPKKLVMWCAVRLMAHATTGKYSNQIVTDLTIIDALQRWGSA
jgi:hypothetical protein